MKSSHPPSLSILYPLMESKVLRKKIATVLLWLLALSAVFLIFALRSSNPFIIATKGSLDQNPPPSELTTATTTTSATPIPSPSNPPSIIRKETLNQTPSNSELDKTTTPPKSSRNQTSSFSETNTSPKPILQNTSLIHDRNEETCDLFSGKWVREPREPIYTNLTCPTLPELNNCRKFGKDKGYMYWRWKPNGCEIPRFDPRMFLNVVRGKKMAFIGDSLARNQMESLRCLLSQAETPVMKLGAWHFPSYDFTLMVMWSQFLVEVKERFINGTTTGAFDLHLDKVNALWGDNLPGLHYVVISAGHWFFRKNYMYEDGKLIGCVLCNEANLTDLGIKFAIRRVFRTVLQYISGCVECEGLVTLLRTYSPSHFEHGTWSTEGYCNRTEPLDESDGVKLSGSSWELRRIQLEEMGAVLVRDRGPKRRPRRFGVLDVTRAMMVRADGHPGSHRSRKWTSNDCLHWCLPGPVDMWNDVLLEVIKKD